MHRMTLADLLVRFKQEARLSTDAGHALHLEESYKALLERTQEDLFLAHDWPQLRYRQALTHPAFADYVPLPAEFDPTGIGNVYYVDNQSDEVSDPLPFGHPVDSWQGKADWVRGDILRPPTQGYPPLAWQLNANSPDGPQYDGTQIELYPYPDRDVRLLIEGKRALNPLKVDTDYTTLDGPLIALHAAVEILAAQKAEDAQVKLQKAQQRTELLLRRNAAKSNKRINFAAIQPKQRVRPDIPTTLPGQEGTSFSDGRTFDLGSVAKPADSSSDMGDM
ncbi:hypothetical protein [uncultured Cohaesibacter sp.]|uniref:hypothetical protein n=1 Tax=uncultured Cohaesibacter sp. TaxID=1002546 RepID=UPI0029C89F27|nr:hypothetical protein [uncultured Cohaesibacter sp.]